MGKEKKVLSGFFKMNNRITEEERADLLWNNKKNINHSSHRTHERFSTLKWNLIVCKVKGSYPVRIVKSQNGK